MAAKKKSGRKPRKDETSLSPEQTQSVLSAIGTEPLSSSDIVEKTGFPVALIRTALQELVENGQVLKEGQKRWTRYRLPDGKSPAPSATAPKAPKLKSEPRTTVSSPRASPAVSVSASERPESPREAVMAWLSSPEASFWDNAQEVSKHISSGYGFPRMEVQAELRDLIKQGRILREFCMGPEGQYRKIKRA